MALSIALFHSGSVSAQSAQGSPTAGQVFFDADSTGFDKEGSKQVFEGNVVTIGAGTMIAADRIELDRSAQTLKASGKTFILAKNQIFAGEEMVFKLGGGDFKLVNAVLLANDSEKVAEMTNSILGFSQRELHFEAERAARLREVQQAKEDIKSEFRRVDGKQDDGSLVQIYSKLLQREQMIKDQLSANLSRMPQQKRDSYQRRRKVWEETKSLGALKSSGALVEYFRLEGGEIKRTNGNDYFAKDALWTPCQCEEDESPAWGFRAPRIDAQMGGYANLYHPVLEIKGIPVLYLPFLKVPLKSERQSGFLPPSTTHEKYSGTVISLPVYFALNKSSDLTLITDFIEKRGTRLGFEYRKQIRQHSGFSLYGETIRDEAWTRGINARRNFERRYRLGIAEASRKLNSDPIIPATNPDALTVNDYEWWNGDSNVTKYANCLASEANEQACLEGLSNDLDTPNNSWRGKVGWNGGVFLAPRLLLVTEGDINSDHRYAEDLDFISREFDDLFGSNFRYRTYNKTKVLAHLDAKNFYMGLGATYGDYLALPETYSGHQIPLHLKWQSRMYSLLGDSVSYPIYGQIDYEALNIALDNEVEASNINPNAPDYLKDGMWQRARARFLLPLVKDQVFRMSHFTDLEQRHVTYEVDEKKNSQIYSWKTGLTFDLPLEGLMKIGEEEYTGFGDKSLTRDRYLKHYMNWQLTATTRPVVGVSGEYRQDYSQQLEGGAPNTTSNNLVYFSSDRFNDIYDEEIAPDEDSMFKHRKLILSTSHYWSFFKKGWSLLPASTKGINEPDMEERARQELYMSLDRVSTDPREILDDNENWLINRYQLQESDHFTPITFDARIGYDFLKSDQLKELKPLSQEIEEENDRLSAEADKIIAENPDDEASKKQADALTAQKQPLVVLPEPWDPLTATLGLSWDRWRLNSSVTYNVNRKFATKVGFNLVLPSYFSSTLSFQYIEDKTSSLNETTREFDDVRTRTRSMNFETSLIPGVKSRLTLSKRVKDEPDETTANTHDYSNKVALLYLDRSECWGVKFERTKDFQSLEENATYTLALTIRFMGQDRPYGNMSNAVLSKTPYGPRPEDQ